MVGEACLQSNAYFPWTPSYTLFISGPCLFVRTFLILACIYPLNDFPKYNFGMLTADTLSLLRLLVLSALLCRLVFVVLKECERWHYRLFSG